ncbi:hypothetical protein NECAME_01988 [Necator americanus]|uniref:RNA helicase n=1 Tax=Necator americanus TaxID=51031 RepID=W2TMA1_NECAM|nr:hypothetical protein NECAME_01988 [Necator americanus]ETN82251.1 hypothetical protein NECAME_01988 [Necator americanus]
MSCCFSLTKEIFHAALNLENSDYVYNTLVCIKDLHLEEPLSDHFLVFLAGRDEIEAVVKKLRELNKHFAAPIHAVPLFGAMSASSQMKAFEPPPEALGAIEANGKELKLTSIGHILCRFPLIPNQARVLMIANELSCLEEALTVIAAMSCETIFDQESSSEAEDSEQSLTRFSSSVSDHLTMLDIVLAFKQKKRLSSSQLKEWCFSNHLNFKNLVMVLKVRKQLHQIVRDCGMRITSCGTQREKLRQALACGLFMNVCEYDRGDDRYRLLLDSFRFKYPGLVNVLKENLEKKRIQIMQKLTQLSDVYSLFQSRPQYIVFTDLVKTTDLYARNVSIIDRQWVQPVIEDYNKNAKLFA